MMTKISDKKSVRITQDWVSEIAGICNFTRYNMRSYFRRLEFSTIWFLVPQKGFSG